MEASGIFVTLYRGLNSSIARCQWLVARGIEDGHVGYEGRGMTHVTGRGKGRRTKEKRSTLRYIFYSAITADPYLWFARLSPRTL